MSGPLDDFLGTGAPTSSGTPDVSALEQAHGIPAGLYAAILSKGERSGVNSISPKGAVGQAQLIPGTAADMGVDPSDPAQNLEGGARYVAQLWQKYKDPKLVAAAYNAGPGAVDRYGGVPPYPETKAYVQRVTGSVAPAKGSLDEFLSGDAPETDDPTASSPTQAKGPSNPDGELSKAELDANADFLHTIKNANVKAGDPSVAQISSGPHQGEPLTQAQQDWVTSNPVDIQAPKGSKNYPYAMLKDSDPPKPGEYYLTQEGERKQVPLTPAQQAAYDDLNKNLPKDGTLDGK